MRPIRIVMKAFGPFAGETTIDFRDLAGRDLFLICGPTGAGKTTILDAMTYALFDRTSGGDRQAAEMRSQQAAPDDATEVTFEFAVGPKAYRLTRRPRQDRPHKLTGRRVTVLPAATLREGETVLADGSEKVTARVERLLGFTCDQFRQVVVLPQGQFREFLAANSTQRAAILETLFGTELYRRIEEALRGEAKRLAGELEGLRIEEQTLLGGDGDPAPLRARHAELDGVIETLRRRETELGRELAEAKESAARLAEAATAAAALAALERVEPGVAAKEKVLALARKALPLVPLEEIAGRARAEAQRAEAAALPSEEERKAAEAAVVLAKRAGEMARRRAEAEAAVLDLRREQEACAVLEKAWVAGQAAVLASTLEAGAPCPVCGGTEHPAPARAAGPVPAESALKVARGALQRAAERAARAEGGLEGIEGPDLETAERRCAAIRKAVEAAQHHAAKTEAAERAEREFARRLEVEGFTRGEYLRARRRDVPELETEVRRFREELAAARDRAGRAQEAARGRVACEVGPLEAAARQAKAELEAAAGELGRIGEKLARIERVRAELARVRERRAALDAEYAVVGRLAEAANGRNPRGMKLQEFVLRSLLDDVLGTASERLRLMSRGRYALRLSGGKGLELEVSDAHTGMTRGVETLSGGEGFLASLALALGLADVVQRRAGGIRMDAVFVDEGFGSLDEEVLDLAMRTLTDLRRRGRMVGVISHVPELRERIDARLVIEPAARGSGARFVLGSGNQ